MAAESSTPGCPQSNTSSRHTTAPAEFDSPASQSSDHDQMSAIQASLLSGKFSDLIVVRNERQWTAHKVVVCSQSAILESMIHNKGGHISVLDLKEFPLAAVSRLMQYLYTNTYNAKDNPPDFDLHSHVAVFHLAANLAIPGLLALAEERFREALNNHVTDLKVYFASVRQIYATTSREHPGLRNAVVEAAVTEMKTLLNSEGARKAFLELLTEVPEFHTDVMWWFADNPNRPVQVIAQQLCEECGPADEENKYVLETECIGCGETKSLEFY